MFNFSTCLLEGITDSVRNAILIQRAMFPREWIAPLKAPDALYGRPSPGLPPTWEPPALPPPPLGGSPPTRPGQEDTHHPKIKLLMDPYLKRYNNYVNIPEIFTASGKHMSDLPTLPKYCHPTGQSFLCWNWALGRCFCGPRCRFARGNLKKGESAVSFADCVTNVISKGVIHKPPSRGGWWRLPQEQTQRRGSWRPCGYLTTVGTGCSPMQNRGRAQRNCISSSCWHMWWSTA